jgi:hypothetical protein
MNVSARPAFGAQNPHAPAPGSPCGRRISRHSAGSDQKIGQQKRTLVAKHPHSIFRQMGAMPTGVGVMGATKEPAPR